MKRFLSKSKLNLRLRQKGFTLVELLVVVGMFGFLMTAMFSSYLAIRKLLLDENKASVVGNQAMLTLKTLSEDLNNLFVEGNWNPKQVFVVKKEILGGKRIDFLNFPSSKLYSNPSTLQSSVRMVAYYGETNDVTGNIDLIRREDAFIDARKPVAGVGVPVFKNIEKLEVQFSRDGVSWRDDWDYATQKVFPKHIRVTLGWKENDREREYTFDVQPPILWN